MPRRAFNVMAGLVPAISRGNAAVTDGRYRAGHDVER